MMEIMQTIGGLVGQKRGALGGGKLFAPTQMPFKSHVGITDGDAAYDTMAEVLAIIGALAAGSVFTLIWEKTVPAQQTIAWGFGNPALPQLRMSVPGWQRRQKLVRHPWALMAEMVVPRGGGRGRESDVL